MDTKERSQHTLDFFINHVILPPKLPSTQEKIGPTEEQKLLKFIRSQAYQFYLKCTSDLKPSIWALGQLLKTWMTIYQAGRLNRAQLETELLKMKSGDTIAFQVAKQNAAVIIHMGDTNVVFECFETSPRAHDVMNCSGRLLCTYPEKAVSIPNTVLQDPYFAHELATYLQKLDGEKVDLVAAKSTKASNTVIEERDTTDPFLVTEMLMAILIANGEEIVPSQIVKHIRDDVTFQNSKLPWRRSPCWLTIRVAMQITLKHHLTAVKSRSLYKNFVLFLVAGLAEECVMHKIPADISQVINAKIARRILKLENSNTCSLLQFVKDYAVNIMQLANVAVQKEWEEVQRSHEGDGCKLHKPPTVEDTYLALEGCRSRLVKAYDRDDVFQIKGSNTPQDEARLQIGGDGIPLLENFNSQPVYIVLMDFETWVEYNSFDIQSSIPNCIALKELLIAYVEAAQVEYKGLPEQISLMLLVAIELWKSIDQMAVSIHPLMRKFPTQISSSILDSILIPKLSQMSRLKKVEDYLSSREYARESLKTSHFADPTAKSFPNMYYDQSESQQRLRKQIEQYAAERRDEKLKEWQQKSAKHTQLSAEVLSLECSYTLDEYGAQKHSPSCTRCAKNKEADEVSIQIYEWPLPENEVQLKAAVFELDCPPAYEAWRDVTWFVARCLAPYEFNQGEDCFEKCCDYIDFGAYGKRNGSRLALASKTKSFYASHYRKLDFPVEKDLVLKKCGMVCRLRDTTANVWASDQVAGPDFSSITVTPLRQGSYRELQYAVDSTVHTSNGVISKQHECDPSLSIHEYIDFGSLRAGSNIQWPNIVRAFAQHSLSLNTEEAFTLISQAAWQAGPSSHNGSFRKAHCHFLDTGFAASLLTVLEQTFEITKFNWKNDTSMTLIVTLVLRILSLGDSSSDQRSMNLLSAIRRITAQWVREISKNVSDNIPSQNHNANEQRLLRIAILCRMTYDMEARYLLEVLEIEEDLATFIEISIILHNNITNSVRHLPFDLRRRIYRDRRISHRLEPLLKSLLSSGSNGIDEGIRRIWSSFNRDGIWESLPYPQAAWITSQSRGNLQDHVSQSVHFNFLNGALLVNGMPTGKLPIHYTQSPLYHKVFGQRTLHVLASNVSTMTYMTAIPFDNQQIYLTMDDGELVIRTRRTNSTVEYELIPQSYFSGCLPKSFSEDYFHWLNISAKTVDFRPSSTKTPWVTFLEGWQLQYSIKNMVICYQLSNSGKFLIEATSTSGKRLAEIFRPFELQKYLHITMDTKNDILVEVELPRYGIQFSVTKDLSLKSSNLSATIDCSQNIGTFFGLQTRLVLRGLEGDKHSRSVIVPFGKPRISEVKIHVNITIDIGVDSRVGFYRFIVDHDLHQLKAPPRMICRLFKAQLHAITGHILPDPLLGRTGTEEALDILREPSSMPTYPMDAKELKLLQFIASLTPMRQFYPKHKRSMQIVKWNALLWSTVQHEDFSFVTEAIADHNKALVGLYPDSSSTPSTLIETSFLQSRAMARNAYFRTREFGGAAVGQDMIYERRSSITKFQTKNAFQLASLVRRWPERLPAIPSTQDLLLKWEKVTGPITDFSTDLICKLLKIDLAKDWLTLFNLCRNATRTNDRARLMFLFGTLGYGSSSNMSALQTLLAIAFSGIFTAIDPPSYASYDLAKGKMVNSHELLQTIRKQYTTLSLNNRERGNKKCQQKKKESENRADSHAKALLDCFIAQWPCMRLKTPSLTGDLQSGGVQPDMSSIMSSCNLLFSKWFQNKELFTHFEKVDELLNTIDTQDDHLSILSMPSIHASKPSLTESIPFYSSPTIEEILRAGESTILKSQIPPVATLSSTSLQLSPMETYGSIQELHSIGDRLCHSGLKPENEYGVDLKSSINAFTQLRPCILPSGIQAKKDDLDTFYQSCKTNAESQFGQITQACSTISNSNILQLAGLFPSITRRTVLKLIASASDTRISSQWSDAIISFAMALASSQRAARLIRHFMSFDTSGFYAELGNCGHQDWDCWTRPDWLLMEVEHDFLIRPIQAKVANEMIRPSSGKNSVLQLSMGEGKSSVIIPLIAAALADGENLARVIVLKPLANSMISLLTTRLGGLLGRKVYHIPFSRKTPLSTKVLDLHKRLWTECLTSRGIAVAQSEHILSYKLVGIERLSAGDKHTASRLIDHHLWTERHVRNVIDESDEVLDVKYQLIYTIGMQKMVDGKLDRWSTIQNALLLFGRHASSLPVSDEFLGTRIQHEGCFPTIHIKEGKTCDHIIELIVHSIEIGDLDGVHFDGYNSQQRSAAIEFITRSDLDPMLENKILETFDYSLLNKLLLLRGLLAGGILAYCLTNKRWMVEYGLSLDRCLLAVPYVAKSRPSQTSEFGHCDVAIILTCLSYYYEGLSDTQLDACFQELEKCPDPKSEYLLWSSGCSCMPVEVRHLEGVNLDNNVYCSTHLFPHLRHNKAVIDFYLSTVVFPRECKEFAKKLSTSAWDIPAEDGLPITTGFSGTNDNKPLLPLSIKQNDLPELLHTSGMVLSYLLQPESREYVCAKNEVGQRLQVAGLLGVISKQERSVRILIDVGAQVLELGNKEVATLWLDLDKSVDAAVYFDDADILNIITRDKRSEALASSRFSDNLDSCVVYLDEAHTRGTDLRLPSNARAAVTLGARLTKDRLVQGCMRLRKLGHGQSLLFVAPPEIDQEVRKSSNKASGDKLESIDVICWSIKQTLLTTERYRPLWVSHGLNHTVRRLETQKFLQGIESTSELINNTGKVSRLLNGIEEQDGRTLLEMYGPRRGDPELVTKTRRFQDDPTIRELQDYSSGLGSTAMKSSSVHEEQQKEVAHEIEVQVQIQRPQNAAPSEHHKSQHVREFIATGSLPEESEKIITPAFSLFEKTSAPVSPSFNPVLFTTHDFNTTVEMGEKDKLDDYLRPVNYVLTVTDKPLWVIISPYEADEFMEDIQKSTVVNLHIFAPKTTRAMRFLEDLNLYTIGGSRNFQSTEELKQQLRIFSGQLYYPTLEAYQDMCKMLRLNVVDSDQTVFQRQDGLAFLKAITEMRMKGQDFSRSHVGKILQGQILTQSSFESFGVLYMAS